MYVDWENDSCILAENKLLIATIAPIPYLQIDDEFLDNPLKAIREFIKLVKDKDV